MQGKNNHQKGSIAISVPVNFTFTHMIPDDSLSIQLKMKKIKVNMNEFKS